MAGPFNSGTGILEWMGDPANMGLLNLSAGLLNASGPSRTPVSTGQAFGQAAMQGVQGFQAAQQAQIQNQFRQVQMAELQRKTKEAEANAALRARLFGDGGMSAVPPGLPRSMTGGSNPDRIEALGTYLALTGNPGAATLLNVADRMRTRAEEHNASESFKSKPGVLGAGVTTTSPQGQALLGNLTGNQDFDSAVLNAQNEALNSNTNLQAQPIQAPKPGLFDPLMASPYVGKYAQQLQGQLDTTSGLKPQEWLRQYDRLQQQDVTSTNAATARGEQAELRREIADQADNTRRMLAASSREGRVDRQQDMEAQRTFTRERSLANDYNNLSKDFRTVLPGFQSSAQYLAGGKYDSAGDRALIFSFARTLDPKDRVGVRDVTDINKLGNIPERMYQAIQGVAEGKMLPDRIRMDMFNVMRDRFGNMNDLQAQIEDEYEKRAKSYMIRPDNVVTRHSIKRDKKPATPNRGATGGWSATEVKK